MSTITIPTHAPAGYYPFQVGRFACLALSDGWLPAAVDELAVDVDETEIADQLTRRGWPTTDLASQISALLIHDTRSHETTLIDTGIGQLPGPTGDPLPTAGRLLQNLNAAGISADAIDTVLISHMHPDHVGGAFTPDGEPVFASARLLIGADELAFWTAPTPDLSRQRLPREAGAALIAIAGQFVERAQSRITTYQVNETIADGITSISVPGHSVGQCAFLIADRGTELLYTADAIAHPVISVERPEWSLALDSDPLMAADTRQRLVADLQASRRLFFTPHFPWPNLGRIGKSRDEPVWTPIQYRWSSTTNGRSS